jgi:uncharacterized membrane protein YfcA
MDFALADVGVWDLALIAGVAFTMSVIGGLSGFGIGLVLPAFLAPVVGVAAVIPVMSVAMTFANASRVWAYWRSLAPRTLLLVMATALPASAVTAFLYTKMSTPLIGLVLGGFLILSVPLRRLLQRWKFRIDDRGLMAIGVGYGLLTGMLSGAGMLMIAALLAAGVTGGMLVGTDAAISTAMNILKIAIFGGSSLLNQELVLAGILIGLCTVPGAFIARRIMDRLPIHVHVWIMEAVIIAGGLSFLWRAFAR